MEFTELKKRFLILHFWDIGFGCRSTGNITDEMVYEYMEHRRNPYINNGNFIIVIQPCRLLVCQPNLWALKSIEV